MTRTKSTFEEKNAKRILENLYLFPMDYLRLSDRPDLISSKKKVGIEVTRAISEEWARQEHVIFEVFGRDLSLCDIQKIIDSGSNRFHEDKRDEIDGIVVCYRENGKLIDTDEHMTLIRNAINRKILKSKKYTKTDFLELYIVVNTSLIQVDDIRDYIFRDDPCWDYFDKIYLECVDTLYVFAESMEIVEFEI
jgi:hypothetical protein